MSNPIPYGRQNINQDDIDAVINVLQSDYLTQGPIVPAFEDAVALYCNVNHAVAVNSATSALHIGCLALGVNKGDWVWTSPITFVASANCALYCGANIDFVDINPATYNISVTALKVKLEQAYANGCLPKVVIPVHLCGQPCEMEAIHALSKQYGFNVIEDASHAIGASYKGEKLGNCLYSDITVFSFHPVKIITTAEGGLATTNNPLLARRMELFRSHGITRDPAEMTVESDGSFYYQQIELGYNYRLTEMQAALGLSQLKRLDMFVNRRHEIAQQYNRLLADVDVVLPWQHPNTYSSLHLYVIRLMDSSRHKEVFEALKEESILVNLHYIPVYRQAYYEQFRFDRTDFPEAEKYYEEAISIPMYYGLSDKDVARVASAIKKIVQKK